MTAPDSVLVARFRRGDAGAFAEIDARHRGPLVGFAARVLRDRASAEEVVQDALLCAHGTLLRDSRPIALRAWLHAVVRNGCFDELRRRVLVTPLGELADRACPAGDPASILARREALRDVLADIDALPARQRRAFLAHAVEGRDHGDVAAQLGATVDVSKNLVRGARRALVASRARRAA